MLYQICIVALLFEHINGLDAVYFQVTLIRDPNGGGDCNFFDFTGLGLLYFGAEVCGKIVSCTGYFWL